MNLIETLFQAMLDNDECTDKQSEYLLDIYDKSPCKKDIDAALICLCGYSLSSLKEQKIN